MKPVAFTLLQNPNFTRLWLVGAVSGTMRWLEVLAIGIYTFEVSASPLLVAAMLFARTIPGVLFGAIIGTMASRLDRRRLLLAGLLLLILNAAVLLVFAWTDSLSVWHIAIGAFISGLVWSMEHPVRRTLIGDFAGVEHLSVAMSLDQVTFNTTRFVGPLCGGLIYAWLGLSGVYASAVMLFALALLLVLGTDKLASAGLPKVDGFFDSLIEGVRYARTEPVLQAVFVVTFIMNFLAFSYTSMVPVVGHDVLDLQAADIGLLQAMEGLGASAGALCLAFGTIIVMFSAAQIFFYGAVLFMLGILLFSLSTNPSVSMIALLIAGPGLAGFGAMQSTLLLRYSEPSQRMRMMGLLVMCIGVAPFGVMALGLLAYWIGSAKALLVFSLTGLVCLALSIYRWPMLIRA